jgi:hypothetical protein
MGALIFAFVVTIGVTVWIVNLFYNLIFSDYGKGKEKH